MRVIVTCAGTGGHIVPAIAIANLIKSKYSGSQIMFIGTKTGMENDLVKNAGYEIESVRTGKLIRSITLKNFKAIYEAIKGIDDARSIMRKFKPDLVVGTGGYICVTVMKAAASLKIPYILHESNAFPGLAIKLTAKKAYRVMLGFDDARARLKNMKNLVVTGNISNIDVEKYNLLDRKKCIEELGINVNKKIVLVTFGSQGAKYLNEYIIDIAKKQNNDILYILITGKNNYDEVLSKIKDIEESEKISLHGFLKVEKFVYDMARMYKVADLCITRAGAMTITELESTKKPAILVPLPTAAENHQYYNAKVLENIGVSSIIEQKNLSSDVLYEKVLDMLYGTNGKKAAEAYKELPLNDVTSRILNEIEKFKEEYMK